MLSWRGECALLKKKVNLWCNPAPKDGVHSSSPNVLVCAPPLVNFVADIVLCSFPFFFLHWGNWQRKVFRLNSIRRATMTETSFNKHVSIFSSAFAHSKCLSKLSVLPKSWFFFSGTCDKPLEPLEPVRWLTDKIAIKGKNRDICNISFLKQNAKNNPSDSSFVLIFELIYILIVWCIRRYHESNFFLDLSKLPAWSS